MVYPDIPGHVPNVIRALSLVPDAVRTLEDLGAAHYMTTREMTDLAHGRSIVPEQTALARSIFVDHVFCLASITVFTAIQLVLATFGDRTGTARTSS